MKPPSDAGQDGFSILEMIVAMTILALILGIASQTIVLASRSISTARNQTEAVRDLRATLANYDAGVPIHEGHDQVASPGWALKTKEIEISNAKLTAIIVERDDPADKHGGSFLTFEPDVSQKTQ